jgi:pimeloyl-ACP methyl ester carboxylesterase
VTPAPTPPTATLVPSTDGVAVAVHELSRPGPTDTGGDAAGPVALIAPANGLCALAYGPLARHLGPEVRCLGLDLRGHGESETPDGLDFAWPGFADDIEAVLDRSDLLGERPDLVGIGHSLGGAALFLAAGRRPAAFRTLWTFEPVVPPPGLLPVGEHPNPIADQAERRRATFASIDAAVANYAGKAPFAALHPDALRGYVEGGFAPVPGGVTLRCRPAWEAAIFRHSAGNGVWEALATIAIPVLVAMGHDDGPFSPAGFAPPAAEHLPRGRLQRHPGLGHFGPLEDPSAMAASVATWLATSRPE